MMAQASLISELAAASLMDWSKMLLRRSLRLSSGVTGFSPQPFLFAVNFANLLTNSASHHIITK
jgi:hypothetical protein